MIARDLVTGLEVGQDRERALEVGEEVVRVERDLRLLWMGGHDCSSVTVLGCALLGAIHPCGAAAGSFGSRLFEDGERLVAMFGEVLLALDGTVPPASMDGEGGVSQGGEGLGGVAGSGAAGVLAAGPIADVVQAVLDSPMPSRDVEQ